LKHADASNDMLRTKRLGGSKILRSALSFVSAAALLLAGFTLAGRALSLWEPVDRPDTDSSAVPVLERRDSDAASRAMPPAVVHSKPSPPVSVRSALLIALGAFALRVFPTRCLWLVRQLEDFAWSLRERVSRMSGGRANLAFASQPGTSLGRGRAPPPLKKLKDFTGSLPKPRVSAVARRENPRRPPAGVRTERTRGRRAETSVRAFLFEFRDDVLIVTLAVILAVTVGILTALYAG
jgi:hypothetical protein